MALLTPKGASRAMPGMKKLVVLDDAVEVDNAALSSVKVQKYSLSACVAIGLLPALHIYRSFITFPLFSRTPPMSTAQK